MKNLFDAFTATVKTHPDNNMITLSDESTTFKRAFQLSVLLGSKIQQNNSPNIGLLMPNSVGFIAGFFGILSAGKSVVPLNCMLTPGELSVMAKHSEIDLIITCKFLEPLARGIQSVGEWSGDIWIIEESLLEPIDLLPPKLSQTDEMAVLLYTSGTTGTPKGVILSHKNLSTNCVSALKAFEFSDRDKLISILPFFHSFGLTTVLLVSAFSGAEIVAMGKFNPKEVFDIWNKFPGGVFFAVPAIYRALVKTAPPDYKLIKPLRFSISGGAPMLAATQESFEKQFGSQILEGYGLSETSPVVSCNLVHRNKRGTVGKLVPRVNVEIRDEKGKSLPPGEEGEIFVQGDSVMEGYYKNPDLTKEVLKKGHWFATGDLGKLDEDGYLSVVGRLKDLIIVAGENIHPREIEEVLLCHPEVSETAVVGVSDKTKGEIPIAFYCTISNNPIPRGEFLELCREKLAPFKIPSEFHYLSEIPKTPTGKISKNVLSKMAESQDST